MYPRFKNGLKSQCKSKLSKKTRHSRLPNHDNYFSFGGIDFYTTATVKK